MLLGMASLSTTVHAQTLSTWTFAGPNPYNTSPSNVAASVVFQVTGTGALKVDLTNTYSGISANNADVLEGVLFDVTGFTTDPTATMPTAVVAPGSNLLDAAGGIVGAAGTDLKTAGAWKFKVLGTATTTDGLVHNYGISDTGGYGISSGSGKGGIVSAATYPGGPGHAKLGSANKPPYTDNEAIFNLSGVTGLIQVSQITNVYFIYNSAGTIAAKGVQSGTPEPGSLALFGAAFGSGVVWFRKRKQNRK